jgi:ubiquinone biosynthesis protein COQ9
VSAHLEAERAAILAAALAHAPFDGWTTVLLERAVKEAGFDKTMARRAFPGGASELIEAFVADADARMVAALETRDLTGLRVRERIATAVRLRLEQNEAHREAIRRAIAVHWRPSHGPAALKGAYRTVDAIWRAIGDTSTDFNFYTKRGLLAAVYGATLLYWLDDASDGFADTWAFLDRRIDDIMRIQKTRGRLEKLAGRVASMVDFRSRSPFARTRRS